MGERETETERYSGGGRCTKLSAGFRRHACPTLSSFPCYSVLDFGWIKKTVHRSPYMQPGE